ncbi:hypothetical protein DPMN_192669 [Dreissena polymorpha]|uniref:Uncharacterized protein n=1 Tax=Dreissena polymorpha TaxID=45954 RepID=A0A9D3Y7J7_DREPO|nr:hypothetical protein DPMN_192669 [Dreissena polymorpha]
MTKGRRSKWRIKHLQELLNRPAPTNPPEIPPATSDLPIKCCTPTKERHQVIEKR